MAAVLLLPICATCRTSDSPPWSARDTLTLSPSGLVAEDDGAGVKVHSSPESPAVEMTSPAELDSLSRLKPPAGSEVPSRTPTEEALAIAAARKPNEPTRIVIELDDLPFNAALLKGANDQTRTSIIEARKADLAPSQGEFESRLRAGFDARNVVRYWDKNEIAVTVPSRAVSGIVNLEGVKAIYPYDGWTVQQAAGYSGVETRAGTMTASMIAAGYTGLAGAFRVPGIGSGLRYLNSATLLLRPSTTLPGRTHLRGPRGCCPTTTALADPASSRTQMGTRLKATGGWSPAARSPASSKVKVLAFLARAPWTKSAAAGRPQKPKSTSIG